LQVMRWFHFLKVKIRIPLLYTFLGDFNMDNYELWLKEITEATKEYKEIKCPLLINNKCSIYDERPNCCRKYPQTSGYYCSKSFCNVLMKKVSNNTDESTDLCFNCKDLCCHHILVPVHEKITKEFLVKWMDISCELCRKYFK
jgi:Fe-S-cluster containining protein